MVKSLCFALCLSFAHIVFAAGGNQIQVGPIKSETLLKDYPLFAQQQQGYKVSSTEKGLLEALPEGLKIVVLFGTWCHDSQREVPRLLSYLQHTKKLKLELYGLDIKKRDPQGLSSKLNIRYTPTFVVFYQDKEIGRIVERPENTLIEDISAMLESI